MKRMPWVQTRSSTWVPQRAASEAATAALATGRWAGAIALLTTWVLLLTLAACGPGLGGTGTGATQEALSAYGAREVAVCTAEFADLLGCPAPGTAAAPLPASGARYFAEAGASALLSRTLLASSGNEAELQLRCLDRLFVGSFGQVGTQSPRYFGVVYAGSQRLSLATLQVQRVGTGTGGTGSGLTLTLVDATGTTLYGPELVLPVAGTTLPASCN